MAIIYFAGAEKVYMARQLADLGVTHLLFSFYYILRRGQLAELFQLMDDFPQFEVFLDSGAFTFHMDSAGKQRNPYKPTEYIKLYKDFLRENGHRFKMAAELDIENYQAIPLSQVDEWREQLVDLGTVPIIPVWHPHRGIEAWEEYCQDPRYPHLGLGSRGLEQPRRARLVNYAHGFKKRVHGFAETKVLTTLRTIKYDTVDSTSWIAGAEYGVTYLMQGRRWIVLEQYRKEQRKKYKKYFKAIGCDVARIISDNPDEVTKANILAWKMLSEQLQVLHRPHVDEAIKILRRDGSIAYARTPEMRPQYGKDSVKILRPKAASVFAYLGEKVHETRHLQEAQEEH